MKVNTVAVLKLLKLSFVPVATWPLPLNASKSAIFRRSVVRWCALVNLTTSEAGLLYTVCQNTDDAIRMILTIAELSACLLIHAKIIFCNRMSHELQVLIRRIEEFVESANVEEMEVMHRIAQRCSFAYITTMLFAVTGALSYVTAPIYTSQILPIAIKYPFSTTSTWIRWALYISQSWTVVQVASTANFDIMCSVLLWYTVARFKILSAKIRRSREAEDIRDNIATHLQLLEYTDMLKPVAQGLTVITTYLSIFCLIGVGYVMLRGPPLYEMVKFTCFEFVGMFELFIYCWPADNLMESSEDIGDAAATCEWIGKSYEMRKAIILMIQRSRTPVIINTAGILPPLSLQLCASTLSSNVGYLTALRSLMDTTE